MLLSRLRYYLASIPTLVRGFRNWPAGLRLILGRPGNHPVRLILRHSGLVMDVRSALDAWLVKEVCLERQYEAASIPIRDGWAVVDIGGGIGEFALDVARRFPRARVFVYEPNPDSFRMLMSNLNLNGLANVVPRPVAVAGTAGHVGLRTEGGRGALTTVVPKAIGGAATAITLEQALAEAGLERCDFLKIDCEGCEYEVLLTASDDTLRRIGAICLEYHDRLTHRSHTELAEALSQAGFRVAVHPNPVHRGQGLLGAVRGSWTAPPQ
jgi:FkbM family methyltransferase